MAENWPLRRLATSRNAACKASEVGQFLGGDNGPLIAHSRQMRLGAIILVLSSAFCADAVSAHPGGMNAEGCHNNRKTGEYHCHRSGSSARPAPRPQRLAGDDSYFPNCASARAAGAAPLRRGDAGYRPGLDRDGDGVACE